jgi:hypothetical protein
MNKHRAERKRIKAELEAAPIAENTLALHPGALKRCERQLERLQETLGAGVAAGDTEAAAAIHDLVETVTVTRDPSRIGGVQVEIRGRLTALLGEKRVSGPHSFCCRLCGLNTMVCGLRHRLHPVPDTWVTLLA